MNGHVVLPQTVGVVNVASAQRTACYESAGRTPTLRSASPVHRNQIQICDVGEVRPRVMPRQRRSILGFAPRRRRSPLHPWSSGDVQTDDCQRRLQQRRGLPYCTLGTGLPLQGSHLIRDRGDNDNVLFKHLQGRKYAGTSLTFVVHLNLSAIHLCRSAANLLHTILHHLLNLLGK